MLLAIIPNPQSVNALKNVGLFYLWILFIRNTNRNFQGLVFLNPTCLYSSILVSLIDFYLYYLYDKSSFDRFDVELYVYQDGLLMTNVRISKPIFLFHRVLLRQDIQKTFLRNYLYFVFALIYGIQNCEIIAQRNDKSHYFLHALMSLSKSIKNKMY